MPAPGTIRRLLPQPDPRLLWYEGFERILDTRLWNRTDTEGLMAVGYGRAAKFVAASSQYLWIASNASLQTGDIDFSVAAWVYLDTKTADSYIVTKWNPVAGGREYQLLYHQASDILAFWCQRADDVDKGVRQATTYGSPPADTWMFVVAWHDAANNALNIQVNGGTVDTSAFTFGVQSTTSQFSMGAIQSGASFDGRISRVGFWKRVLTADERTYLYNSGNGRDYAELSDADKVSLTSWWQLGELSGTRADSVVASANDLAQSGSPLWGHGPTRSGLPGLVFSGGRSLAGDPGLVHPRPIRRQAGRAIEARVQSRATNTIGPYLVLSSVLAFNAASQREHGLVLAEGALTLLRGATSVKTPYAYSANTDYYLLIVEDATGAHYYASTDRVNWTLLFVDSTGSTASLYAVLYTADAAGQVQPVQAYRRRVKPPLVSVAGPFGVTTAVGVELWSNTGFETAGGGGADVFANWTEVPSGTSTINDEGVIVQAGSHACRFDVDALASLVYIRQGDTTTGAWYRNSAYLRASIAGAQVTIGQAGNNRAVVLTTAYTLYGTSYRAGAAVPFPRIGRGSGSANTSIYADESSWKQITWSSTFGSTAYTTPASNTSLRFKVPICTAGMQAGMVFKRVDDNQCLTAYWDRNDGTFKVDQYLSDGGGGYTVSNLASATLAYDATAEVQCVWNGADLRVHVGTTAIGAGLTVHANLLAATDARVWATDDDSRVGPIAVEGGLP